MYIMYKDLEEILLEVLDLEMGDKSSLKERKLISEAIIERLDGDILNIQADDDDEDDEQEEDLEDC